MNPSFDFKWLKSRITIAQVLSAYGLDSHLKQKNDTLYGPCPLHQGNNPTAFRADLTRGLWHCFTACGGGDIVELVRRIENGSHQQAARSLKYLVDKNSNSQSKLPPLPLPHQPFTAFTRKLILDPNTPFLQKQKNISALTAICHEAGVASYSHFLKNMVAVRLYDFNGNPLGYCGRRLLPVDIDKWGKWRFPKNFPKAAMLFNAHRAYPHRQKGIVLVECPWAAMRLAQAGVKNTVALLGTSLSAAQIQWIIAAPAVLLMLDADPAGRKAATQIAAILNNLTKTILHQLPDGMEPEDLSDDQLRSIAKQYSFF
ncbi:MAG: toprim domain-containing protein [Deltaproteobacteria bacterium]|nr:toprim domain-containing protein [Deltaproteobacteria bacterium]